MSLGFKSPTRGPGELLHEENAPKFAHCQNPLLNFLHFQRLQKQTNLYCAHREFRPYKKLANPTLCRLGVREEHGLLRVQRPLSVRMLSAFRAISYIPKTLNSELGFRV